MEINCTLFVQMGNFLVAYIMLRTLFLKPALSLLRLVEQHKTTARTELQRHESQLLEQRSVLQAEWTAYKKYCRRAVPRAVDVVRAGPGQEGGVACAVSAVTPEERERLAADLEERITAKVSHVRA